MRDIKFRGRAVEKWKWVYGFYLTLEDLWRKPIDGKERITRRIYSGCADSCVSSDGYDFSGDWNEVIPETVGQFTGVCDKNGKEIFEGDILNTEKYQIVEVIFDNGAFMTRYFLNNGMEHRIMFWDLGDMEVIGNIHDNPELMKGDGT